VVRGEGQPPVPCLICCVFICCAMQLVSPFAGRSWVPEAASKWWVEPPAIVLLSLCRGLCGALGTTCAAFAVRRGGVGFHVPANTNRESPEIVRRLCNLVAERCAS